MAKLRLILLGGFEAFQDRSGPVEFPTRKARALLAWLALNPDRRLARELAGDFLWGDSPQKQANASLSQALYSLRKELTRHGCDAIRGDNTAIFFASEGLDVDAVNFRRLVAAGDPDSLAQAERLWGGEFLEGFPAPTPQFEDWMASERRHLHETAADALSALLALRAGQPECPAFAETARRLTAIDPYHEPACRALMVHYATQGRIGSATEAFDLLRGRLREDLNTTPSEETKGVHARILQRQSATAAGLAGATAVVPGAAKPVAAASRPGSLAPVLRILGAVVLIPIFLAAMAWLQDAAPRLDAVDPATMEHPLPARPSIAVLAFDDLSQGDDTGYLSDAIAEDIITELSRFPELFVIARNSSFHYRDRALNAHEIARELGVRYLLEGSQQKSAHQLRITVQLVDAVGGNDVLAETYDRDLADIFRVQDEIADSVASMLGERLRTIAGEEAKRANPAQLRAFEHWLAGLRYFREFTRAGSDQARRWYESSLEADPDFALGHIGLAWIYINGYRWGWTELDRDDARDQARQEARIALELAPDDYNSHFTMAAVHMQAGERAHAISEFERALKLNPNAGNVMATYAEVLGYSGRFREAVEWLQKAMRLDPYHPEWFYWNLGWAQYSMGDCEAALMTIRKMSRMPPFANRTLAAIFVCLGRLDEARTAIGALMAHEPEYSVAKFRLNFKGKYEDPANLEAWIDDLRIAGLPDSSP